MSHISIQIIVGLYESSPIQPNYQELPYIFPSGQAPWETDVHLCPTWVVPVNHSKLDFANLTKIWRKILICNEFTLNISQYLFAIFCFYQHQLFPPSIPGSVTTFPPSIPTISTQHPDEKKSSDISLSGTCICFVVTSFYPILSTTCEVTWQALYDCPIANSDEYR